MLSRKVDEMSSPHANMMETGNRITGIVRSTEAASIGLLNAIGGTVDTMTGIAKVMSGFASMIVDTADEIRGTETAEGMYLDPDDTSINAIERSEGHLKDFLTKLVRKRSAIDKDRRLGDHHCESLHDAYDEATSAVAELIEELRTLRAAIISHDLKAEPREGSAVFDTVDQLIADLRGQ